MFDKVIKQLQTDFSIERLEDWQRVRPEWIRQRRNVGKVTLDHIRLYLAIHGITLEDDATPEYWQERLSEARIGQQMGQGYDTDSSDVVPFTVLIDSMEQHPFTFTGLKGDAEQNYRPLIVPTKFQALGAGKGDYSIAGYEGQVHIERKSCGDAIGTILGWEERRPRFERELDFLSQIECGAVVVECSFGVLVASVEARKKSKAERAKSLHRSILALAQDYRVPWHFCDTRRFAEQSTFRILYRYWQKQIDAAKASERKHTNPVVDPVHDETAPINTPPVTSLF